jgi:hypothetical protein
MSFCESFEKFIGQRLAKVNEVVADYGDDGKLTHAIALEFGAHNLVLEAEASDDSLTVHECDDLRAWLRGKPDSDNFVVQE